MGIVSQLSKGNAVGFGVEIGGYRGRGSGSAARLPAATTERPTPARCVEAYYLQRIRFESIAERKIRRRQLTQDGNVEISGRDFARGFPAAEHLSPGRWR